MIYVASILNGKYVKIGYCRDDTQDRRIASLQTGSPFKIEYVFGITGTLVQEQELHKALRIAFGRIRLPMPPNEWYPARNPFFKGFIEYLKYGLPAGIAYLDNYNPSVKQVSSREDRKDVEPNLVWPRN